MVRGRVWPGCRRRRDSRRSGRSLRRLSLAIGVAAAERAGNHGGGGGGAACGSSLGSGTEPAAGDVRRRERPMIRFDEMSVTYAGAPSPTLRDLDLAIPEGELALVIGPTGSGKSTLLGTVNGQVPRFTGGTLAGRVTVDGRDTAVHTTREMADLVGVVPQHPAAGFVTDVVEEELAYGMEQLGLPPAVMRRRVEETLDLLGIAHLRDRAVASLSGGEQQRVAIGAVLTTASAGAGARRADFGARPDRLGGGARRGHPAGARPGDDGGHGRAPPGTRRAVRRPGDRARRLRGGDRRTRQNRSSPPRRSHLR